MSERSPIPTRRLAQLSLAFAAILSIALALDYRRLEWDDVYIFLTYARNIASGQGYVFNPGEHFNGTTSPLYTLILSAGAWCLRSFTRISLPQISTGLMALCLWLICFFGTKIVSNPAYVLRALFFPVAFLLHPYIRNAAGMETFLTLALILAAAYCYQIGRLRLTAALAALAMLSRPDSALFVVILAAHYIVTRRALPPWQAIAVFGLCLLPWFAFSIFYFGTWIPGSVAAKITQTGSGTMGAGWLFLKGFRSQWHGTPDAFPRAMAMFGFVALAAAFTWRRAAGQTALWLVLIWNVALALTYVVINPPAYPWYFTPFVVGWAIVLSLGLEVLSSWILSAFRCPAVWRPLAVLTVVAAGAMFVTYQSISSLFPDRAVNGWKQGYIAASEWLNANAADGSSVACAEVGFLGYYYRKGPVLDSLGLVTAGVSEHVAKGDTNWLFLKYSPDYIMLHRPIWSMEHIADTEWFARNYVVAHEVSIGTLYARKNNGGREGGR